MKNICFLNSTEFWGGGEKLHLEYALEFRKKNYNVFIAARKNSPLSEISYSKGLEISNTSVSNLSFINPLKLLKFIRFLIKNEIDTIVFTGSRDMKFGGIAAKLAKVPNIVYLRGLASPIKNSFLNRLLLKNILTHIVASSQETKRAILCNLHNHIEEDKVKVIYHGIQVNGKNNKDKERLSAIKSAGHGIILGNAGRLATEKGQHYLIEIAKRLKEKNAEFTLFIAGTGVLQTQLENLIEKYGLQKEVILLGFIKDIGSFMNSLDIFLWTSLGEGFGFAVVEAMSKSVPVVAFNISSNPEIIQGEKSGFLIDFPDLDMFTEKVMELIKDESKRLQFGETGQEIVMQKFQLKQKIAELENLLSDTSYNRM